MSRSSSLGVLLRADARRMLGLARRPSASVWLGIFLPAGLLVAGVRAVGAIGAGDLSSTQSGVTLGIMIGGPVAFLAYGTLFRGVDDGFLRRLGVGPGALYGERALRLLALAGSIVLLAVVAYSASGVSPWRVLAVAAPPAVASWGMALLAFATAARAMARHEPNRTWGCLAAGMWDRDMALAAPLVHAPLLPLFASGIAGGVAGGVAPGNPLPGLVIAAVGVASAVGGASAYGAALPRFGPQALEMSFAATPLSGGETLRVRKGLARLLPRRAGAAWARDMAVASRRFAWATRITWPVVIFAFVALARWGEHPETRGWVVSAGLLVLVVQAAAAIGIGRLERGRARWMDRAVGIPLSQRFVGRWAWGWGVSLWMTVPVALSWGWWAGAGTGWPWVGVAAATSGVAAAASMAAAGRR